jgi:hypothetical protein
MTSFAAVSFQSMHSLARAHTECPLLKGPMSRNASVFSLSKSFMQGISPGFVRMSLRQLVGTGALRTLDNLAEDTGGHDPFSYRFNTERSAQHSNMWCQTLTKCVRGTELRPAAGKAGVSNASDTVRSDPKRYGGATSRSSESPLRTFEVCVASKFVAQTLSMLWFEASCADA